jgi:hypothetical protein
MEHRKSELQAPKAYFFVYYYLLAGILLLVTAFLFTGVPL